MTSMTEITLEEAGGNKSTMQKHNSIYWQKLRENQQMQIESDALLAQQRNLFAAAITLSLRPKAPLRLEALRTKHAVVHSKLTWQYTWHYT